MATEDRTYITWFTGMMTQPTTRRPWSGRDKVPQVTKRRVDGSGADQGPAPLSRLKLQSPPPCDDEAGWLRTWRLLTTCLTFGTAATVFSTSARIACVRTSPVRVTTPVVTS